MFKPSHQTFRRMTYFAAIAEAGSIRGAAAKLGLSVPVISTALSELEEELNATLAVRTTRSFALTSTGEKLFVAVRALLSAAANAMEVADGSRAGTLTGRLSLSVTTEMASHWLPPILTKFRCLYPEVSLRVDARDEVVALNSSGFDLAVRAVGPQPANPDEGLGNLPLLCVARNAPRLQRSRTGWTVDSPLLTATEVDPVLQAWDAQGKQALPIQFSETIVVTNRDAARHMAMSGLGAALVLGLSVEEDIRQSRLVPILPELAFGVVSYDLVMRDALPSREAHAFAELLRDGPFS